MNLFAKKTSQIQRPERDLRTGAVVVVATDDTYAPMQYFRCWSLSQRIRVKPTPPKSGHSSPKHVVDRLLKARAKAGEIYSRDEYWVLLDSDHHFDDNNWKKTLKSLSKARRSGFEVIVSKPCFEIWLLLHHAEISPATDFGVCANVEEQLRSVLGSYCKSQLNPGQFTREMVPKAIERARQLDTGVLPKKTGTRVYLLLEHLLNLPPTIIRTDSKESPAISPRPRRRR
jgi:hypothetical protein